MALNFVRILVALLVLCLLLPAIAHAAQAAVPALVSILLFLGLVRLAWPPRRHR